MSKATTTLTRAATAVHRWKVFRWPLSAPKSHPMPRSTEGQGERQVRRNLGTRHAAKPVIEICDLPAPKRLLPPWDQKAAMWQAFLQSGHQTPALGPRVDKKLARSPSRGRGSFLRYSLVCSVPMEIQRCGTWRRSRPGSITKISPENQKA